MNVTEQNSTSELPSKTRPTRIFHAPHKSIAIAKILFIMKADLLVYDVMERFSETFTTFPLRLSFEHIAQDLTTHPLETFTKFKECARQSVSLLPASLLQVVETTKPATRSMQATRVAVRVFSILDLSAMRTAISSSKDCASESRMRERCKMYDLNTRSIFLLYGRLPVWQKHMPAIAITYLRCAVKVAQRRFRKATANLEGERFMQVFTTFEIGDTAMELEHMCDKLETHLTAMESFVETNCVIPETDPDSETITTRNKFKQVMKCCRSLVLHFNKILPILYIVNTHLREKLKSVWLDEIDEDEEWTLEKVDLECVNMGARFVEFSPSSTREMIENIRFLHEAAEHEDETLNDLVDAQVSTIASADFACATIALMNNSELNSFGYTTDRSKHTENDQSSTHSNEVNTQRCDPSETVTLVRNNHLQSDLFCTWCSIIAADKFLEEDLILSNNFRNSSLQLCLPDDWYNVLFSRILVPDLVINAISSPYQNKLLEASSRLMRLFAEKSLRPTQ